jgi:replication factor C small subunit
MLWIEKYRPEKFEDIYGQEEIISHMAGFARSKNIPHMLLFGPHGTGKTCAVQSLAKEIYGDYSDENLSVIQAGILFTQGKTWLENEERFSHLYRKEESLINNFKHIVKWYASMKPFEADFKILAFEEADMLPFAAQAALRRIMEKYSQTCRFILLTRRSSTIIPAIYSRCLPLFFKPLPNETVIRIMKEIMKKENISGDEIPDDDLDLIAEFSKGDCRKAITYLQITAAKSDEADIIELSRSEISSLSAALFMSIKAADFAKSKQTAEMMMIEYGLTAGEVINEISKTAGREYNDPRIALILGDADYSLTEAGNEYLQINALISNIISEVFN